MAPMPITLGTSLYKKYCEKNGIHTLYIDNANHSLEVEGKPYESIEVLKMVMEFIEVNSEF